MTNNIDEGNKIQCYCHFTFVKLVWLHKIWWQLWLIWRLLYVDVPWCTLIKRCVFFSYKHALDGLIRVLREEGVSRLFRGASTATFRAVLMTIGQLSFYDQIKGFLLSTPYFKDNLTCHFTSSLAAVRFIFFVCVCRSCMCVCVHLFMLK